MRRSKKKRTTHIAGQGPARTIINQCPHRMVGAIHYPGLTLYPAVWESPWERKLISLLLMCHDVISIGAQPEEIIYQHEGGDRRYTPDIAITTSRGRILVEVKNLSRLIKSETLEKYLLIARIVRSQGKRLDFITDNQILPMWFKNAYLLRRYLSSTHSEQTLERVLSILEDGPRKIGELLVEIGQDLTLIHIYALIGQRVLCINWDTWLDRHALVSLPDRPFRRLTYDAIHNSGRFADLLAEMALGRRPTDQRLLAAARARRRPLSVASPLGFVDGFTPAQLGSLERLRVARVVHDIRSAAKGNGDEDRSSFATTSRD